MFNKTDKNDLIVKSPGPPITEFQSSPMKIQLPKQNRQHVHERKNMSTILPEMRLVNPENDRSALTEETFKKLLEMNQQYLYQKIRISDVPTPAKYSHKMPSKTGQSEYYMKYGSSRGKSVPEKKLILDQKGSNVKMPTSTITGYQSVYHTDFAKKASDSSVILDKKKYQKSDAPTFNQSSYHRDYGVIKASPTTSAKRAEVRLMGGGQLSADTTYKQNFRLKTQGYKPVHPIIQKKYYIHNNSNRIFMTLNKQTKANGSCYRDQFQKGKKKQQQVESCKPKQQYSPNTNKLKYKTEYAGEYIKQDIKEKRVFECLSPEQLKSYVMGILND